MISADSGFGSSWGGAQVTKPCLSHCLAGRGHGFHHNSGSCHPCSRPRLKSAIMIIICKIFTRIVLHLCRSQRKSFLAFSCDAAIGIDSAGWHGFSMIQRWVGPCNAPNEFFFPAIGISCAAKRHGHKMLQVDVSPWRGVGGTRASAHYIYIYT